MRPEVERVRDMLEAVERIERYAAYGRVRFDADELVQTWVVHHLQVIGEAARTLTPEFRGAHPEVPWRDIVGMRHILVHRYFGIDLDAVWSVVEEGIPELRRTLTSILDQASDGEAGATSNDNLP